MNIVVNAGVGEGLAGWYQLVAHYEPRAMTGQVGMLVELLGFSFSGDVESRLEEFDRACFKHDLRVANDGAKITESMKVGVVIRNLEDGPLRSHLLLNIGKLDSWAKLREEVRQIRRAQTALTMSGPVPMEIGAFSHRPPPPPAPYGGRIPGGRGGKEQPKGKTGKNNDVVCNNCGRPGHYKRECWRPGGGAAKDGGKDGGKNRPGKGFDGKTANEGKDRRSGGGSGKGVDTKDVVCHKCHKKGHYMKDYPMMDGSKTAHSLEDDPETRSRSCRASSSTRLRGPGPQR